MPGVVGELGKAPAEDFEKAPAGSGRIGLGKAFAGQGEEVELTELGVGFGVGEELVDLGGGLGRNAVRGCVVLGQRLLAPGVLPPPVEALERCVGEGRHQVPGLSKRHRLGITPLALGPGGLPVELILELRAQIRRRRRPHVLALAAPGLLITDVALEARHLVEEGAKRSRQERFEDRGRHIGCRAKTGLGTTSGRFLELLDHEAGVAQDHLQGLNWEPRR